MSWDDYFLSIATAVASNSKCMSRQIGAVLVNERSIVSTGYNGPPRGIPHCEIISRSLGFEEKNCPRRLLGYESGKGLHICPAGHAERNALINAARHGVATKDTSLYLTCGVPCKDCMIEIINAGVKEIVVTSLRTYDKLSKFLLVNSNIELRVYNEPRVVYEDGWHIISLTELK